MFDAHGVTLAGVRKLNGPGHRHITCQASTVQFLPSNCGVLKLSESPVICRQYEEPEVHVPRLFSRWTHCKVGSWGRQRGEWLGEVFIPVHTVSFLYGSTSRPWGSVSKNEERNKQPSKGHSKNSALLGLFVAFSRTRKLGTVTLVQQQPNTQ